MCHRCLDVGASRHDRAIDILVDRDLPSNLNNLFDLDFSLHVHGNVHRHLALDMHLHRLIHVHLAPHFHLHRNLTANFDRSSMKTSRRTCTGTSTSTSRLTFTSTGSSTGTSRLTFTSTGWSTKYSVCTAGAACTTVAGWCSTVWPGESKVPPTTPPY